MKFFPPSFPAPLVLAAALVPGSLSVAETTGVAYFPALVTGEFKQPAVTDLTGAATGETDPTVLWAVAGGGAPELYGLRSDGSLAATVSLGGTVATLEDMAVVPNGNGGGRIFLGDTGGQRESVKIVVASEPALPAPTKLSGISERILRYPDGPHASSALMVDPGSGDIYIVTDEASRARVYRAESGAGAQDLELVAEVGLGAVSAGDISADGSRILLRNAETARVWERGPGQSVAAALATPGAEVPVLPLEFGMGGEAVAFENAGAGYFAFGKSGKKKGSIFSFRQNGSAFDHGTQTGKVDDRALEEISGVAVSRRTPGVLWVHNDGDINSITALDKQGKTVATVRLGRTMSDAEDITIGDCGPDGEPYLFVGDVGDNDEERRSFGVLRFPEPVLDLAAGPVVLEAAGAEWLPLAYPGAPANCEAVLYDPATKDLLFATKEDAGSRIFRVPAMSPADEPVMVDYVTKTGFNLVSGGDISADGSEIVLRREERAELWKREGATPLAEVFRQAGTEIPVKTPPVEGNGEAIAFTPDGNGYYTIGEDKKRNAPVFFYARRPTKE